MANLKTTQEANGAPLQKTDLFRIARASVSDNFKVTAEEIFSETVSNRTTFLGMMSSASLIPGKVYKVLNPSLGNFTDTIFVQAVTNTKIDPLVAAIVNSQIVSVYYDFAGDKFGYIDTTYAVLRADMLSEKLIPGMTYRISDYVSKNFLNGYSTAYNATIVGSSNYLRYPSYYSGGAVGSGNPDYDAFEVYTSPVEPLYVKAITKSELDPIAQSELYPDDIIYYNPLANKLGVRGNPASLSPLQWDSVNNYAYVDFTGDPLLYGQPIYLVSYDGGVNESWTFSSACIKPGLNKASTGTGTFLNNYSPSINRNYIDIAVENNGNKLILYISQVDQAAIATTYLSSTFTSSTQADITGHVYRRIDPTRNIDCCFDFRNRRYRRFEIDMGDIDPMFTGYVKFVGIGYEFYDATTTGNYVDLPTFSDFTENVSIKGGYSLWGNGDNIVFLYGGCYSVDMDAETTYDNTFVDFIDTFTAANWCYANVFMFSASGYGADNSFKFNCFRNVIAAESFYGNTIGTDFGSNLIAGSDIQFNLINNNFGANKIGYIGEFIGNSITGRFQDNIAVDPGTFSNNVISSDFTNCTFNNNSFANNYVKTYITGLDFDSATHVSSSYTCDIIQDSTSAQTLIYFDGTSFQSVSPTA